MQDQTIVFYNGINREKGHNSQTYFFCISKVGEYE